VCSRIATTLEEFIRARNFLKARAAAVQTELLPQKGAEGAK
jgi:hypothetical protein